MAEHGFPDYHSNLLIDKVRTKYSWAKGSSRGSDEAVSQHSRDLAVAFAEIDGLMAGFKYTDKLQQLSIDDDDADMSSPCASADSSSPPSYPIRLDIPLGDALDDPPRPEESLGQDNTATTPSNLPPAADTVGGPMARQWDAILELRKEINQHHKRFLVQTQGTDDAIIQSLRTEFPCANKIRETGPLLMRGILEGDQPESIADIFAFTSLSYAVSKILIRRNRMKQSDILADLDVWRDAISDPAERMSFDIISQKLWPEAQGGGWYADGAGPAAPPHVDQDVPYPRDLSTYVIRQFVQTHQACDYEWAAHNLPAWGVDHYENMTPGRALSNSGPVQFEYTHEPQLPGPSAAAPQEPLHGPGLQRSMTFLVVFTYLLEIEQLVLTLSGQTLVPSPHKPSKLFLRDRFLTELKALFVESPLGASKKSDFRFRAFLSVALFLASLGYFKSISEVKHYMITVGGSAVFPPGPLFENFLLWVMRLPQALPSPTLSPEVINRKRARGPDSDPNSPLSPEDSRKRRRSMPTCSIDKCRGMFETDDDLRRHTEQMHPSHRCSLCDFTNTRKDRLDKHIAKKHPLRLK